ncbi:uncharacterized protein LOC108023372 isoform X2 [Drosophila biarmipes]|uniref:uncharacterized protein LOC108023372 isoform X2 n=1 Tax=Drosophila biarmipes TaxID=125945 RepID=UPI0007E5D313|nr:uncharacterized protein LOC108023372 isoform X2 [Drosophila biarmipes]
MYTSRREQQRSIQGYPQTARAYKKIVAQQQRQKSVQRRHNSNELTTNKPASDDRWGRGESQPGTLRQEPMFEHGVGQHVPHVAHGDGYGHLRGRGPERSRH